MYLLFVNIISYRRSSVVEREVGLDQFCPSGFNPFESMPKIRLDDSDVDALSKHSEYTPCESHFVSNLWLWRIINIFIVYSLNRKIRFEYRFEWDEPKRLALRNFFVEYDPTVRTVEEKVKVHIFDLDVDRSMVSPMK